MKLNLLKGQPKTSSGLKLRSALLRKSEAVSREEAKKRQASPKPLKRIEPPAPAINGRITIKTNKVGNFRGTNPTSHFDSEAAKLARAKRKIYNKQMPVLACNNCVYSATCPQFKAGYVCAYNELINSHSLQTQEEQREALRNLAEAGMRRFHLATAMETLSGAPPSLELTETSALVFGMVKQYTELENGMTEVTIEQGGVIGELFGGLDNLIGETTKAVENPPDALPVIEGKPLALKEGAEVVREVADDYVKMGLENSEESGKSRRKPVEVNLA